MTMRSCWSVWKWLYHMLMKMMEAVMMEAISKNFYIIFSPTIYKHIYLVSILVICVNMGCKKIVWFHQIIYHTLIWLRYIFITLLSIHLTFYQSVHISVFQTIHLSIYPFIYNSIRPLSFHPIHPFFWLSHSSI